jgi:hypothetical protein
MKKLLIVFLFLMFLAIGWLLRGIKLSSPITQSAEQKPTTSTMLVSTSSASKFTLPSGWQVMSVDEKIASPAGQARIERFDQVLRGENAKPINVYGKVIDQYGQPVVGAEVKGGTLLYVNPERSGGESFSTITDAQGQFSFTGLHGVRFGFGIEKLGYEYDRRKYLDWWDSYKPDPINPAVFVMWKLQGAEPMLHSNVNKRLPYDEQSASFRASFDLGTGKIRESGDLHITLIQNPVVVKRALGNFAWKIIITVPGGNLLEATDLYKNLAPESGYQDAYSFAQERDDPKWTARFAKTFYVHTAKGKYAKVTVDLTPGTNRPEVGLGVGLSLETWLNPSGSRNLEFDAAKEIKPGASDRTF